MYLGNDGLVTVLIALVIIVFLFFVFRELLCWYWKINELIYILRRIEAKLPSLIETSEVEPEIESPLTSVSNHDIPWLKTSKEDLLMKGYRERFTTYTTEKLIKMKSKGSSSYTEEALIVISEILKERGE